MKKLDFLPNLRNRYSIRKFAVGTASILIGSLLFLGHNGEIKAAENTNDNTVIKVSKDTSHPQQEVVENVVLQEKTADTPQQANDSQTTQNELENVKTEGVSKLSKSTYLTEAKQAQSKADTPTVVDGAKKAENELVKQAEQEKAADTTTAQTKAVAEKSVPKNETVKKESKTELSSVKTSETPKTSEAETVATPNNTVPAVDAIPLTTVQKVDEVKKELAPNYDSSKIDAALAVIDTNDLSASQIKAEVLKVLIDQSSAQKDLYTPQATLVRKKRDTQETAVRPFQVDTSTKDEVVVTKDNFNDYFLTVGDATYNPATGIATLTPNEKSKKGAISLDTKLNINKDFHFSGAINLGDKGEGHEKDGVPGGDGIGFMFNPGKVHQLGLYGAGLGFGGLPYTFGFKFDTFVNNGYDRNGKAQPDPRGFNGKGSFGAFVYANAAGEVLTQAGDGTFKAALLNHQPHDNQFVDLTIDYRADTQVMTINYGGQVWSKKMNTYFNYTKKKDFALSICASTGGAYNLQQVRIDRFTYTASALLEEDFVDEATQALIDTPTRISGDVDDVIKIEDPTSKLQQKGYKIISKDTTLAPDYDSEDNTVKLTNDTQFIVYKLKDIQPPVIGSISNITSDVDKPINPIKLNINDNSGKLATKTVTGLPEGLTFNETTNEITGIPTKVGSTTVTVTATDSTKLRTTKTFIYTVADTVVPVITAVETKKTEAYAPITPITVEAEDNSKVAPTLVVTGLPTGLTFNSITKQITGKPTFEGKSTVTITATDASKNTSTSMFDIMVQPNKALETLKTVTTEAKAMAKDDFTPNSVKSLDSKVAEADVLIAHPENGSTDTFNEKTQAVKQAKDQLVYKANKDKLEKAIVEAGMLGQLNADDTEDKAVRDKLAIANTVKADDNATKEQVDTATTQLNEVIAQKRYQDALDRLNTAIADANGVNQAEYTPKTVTPFNTVLKAGETTATDKTMKPEQLDSAAQAIIGAKEQLRHKADKSALEAAIHKAKALGVLSVADKEDKVVQDALSAGEGVKDNLNASQQEVQNATQSLNDAVVNKEHADALDALKSKLAEVKALDKTPYTPNSINTLNRQVAAGDAVVADEKSKTTEEVKAETQALIEAKNALVNQADKTELDKAIKKVGTLGQLDVGDTEDKAVQNALATANQVKGDGNATLQQVVAATQVLNDAIATKVRQDALDELNTTIKEAKAVIKENYTPETVTPFETAMTDGYAKAADAKSTPEQLKEAAQVIKHAKDTLKQKANKDALNQSVSIAEALQPFKAGDPEDDGVKAALAKAKQVQTNPNVDQTVVDESKVELDKAVKVKQTQDAADALKQAALDELKAALAKVAKIDRNNFTPNSVQPLTEKERNGNALVDNPNHQTVDEIKAATEALKEAQKGLQAKSDKEALQAAIAKAEALTGLNPTDKEDGAIQDALTGAKVVKENPNATQQEVQKATQVLNEAIIAKAHADALDTLKAELAKVASLNKEQYTPKSVMPLNSKEADGKAIVAAPNNKTTDEIKTATQLLKDAETGLVDRANKAVLQAAIEKAATLPNLNPSDKEDKVLQNALATAQTVKDNADATIPEVQKATERLNNAVAMKARQDALDELQKALDAAKDITKDDYKPNTVKPFEAAITAGENAKLDTNKTPDELKKAAQAIKDTQTALAKKANKAGLNTSIQQAEGLGILDPADVEDKAVQLALAKAKTIKADPNVEQAAVDVAKGDLDKTIKAKQDQDAKEAQEAAAAKQAALDALKAELVKVNQIDKNSFTPNTTEPLTAKETAGKAIVAAPDTKTTDEIKAVTQALKDAQNNLVQKADKTVLKEALDKAIGFNRLDKTDAEDKALDDALVAGQKIEGDLNATPEEVKQAADNLNKAIAAKEHQDALDELQKALDAAKIVDKNNYKPNTVTPFEAAITAGKNAKVDTNKTLDELKAAEQAIKDTQTALAKKANKTDLNTSVQTAEGLGQLEPTDAEDKAVQNALTKAKAVQNDPNTEQATVDTAKIELDNAVNAKKVADAKEAQEAAAAKQAALDELKAELAKVAKIDRNNFTPNSVQSLTEKERNGNALVTNPNHQTVDEIKAATQALKKSQNNLVKKADKAELQKAIVKAEALPNLDATDKEDKAVQDALTATKVVKENPNATQLEVQKATEVLNNAVAAKERQDALDELQKALADAAQVNKNQYKPNSVAPFEAAVNNGTVAKNDTTKTTTELKEATQAINNAKKALHEKANKEGLDNSITAAGALQPLKEGDAEDVAVKAALEKAKAVQADQNTDQVTVDSAKTELDNAVNAKKAADAKEAQEAAAAKQAALDELKAELAKVKTLDKDTFTPSTVTPLNKKEIAGQAIVDASDAKTTDEIKAVTQALKDTEAVLVKRTDKGDLERAIEKANALGQIEPTDAEDKVLKDALQAGQVVEGDGNATPQQVADATKAINEALVAKEHQDALDELNKVIDKAQKIEQADYTPESVKPLDTAKTAGQTLATDKAATTEQLKAATKLINEAINQLVVDKTELTKQIEAAKAFEPLNASATDQLLKHVLDTAIGVQNNPNAIPQEVKEATWNLEDEIGNKIASDAIEALRDAINKSTALKAEDYTPNSYAPLKTATSEGQSILDDPSSADLATTIAKTKEIKQLIDTLKGKADKTDLNMSVQTTEGLGQLDPTDAEDKAVQDALTKAKAVQADPNADQVVVDASKTELDNAVNAKKAADAKEAQDKADALNELQTELEKVKALDKTEYTPNTVTLLSEKEDVGKAIVDAPDAKTTDEIKAATQALKDAEKALQPKADKTALEAALDKAVVLNHLDDNDTEDKAVHDALLAGQEVEGDLNATPEEVKKAADDLNNALAAKERQDVLDELQKALDSAKADATKTPEELKAAVKAINDAKGALHSRANKTDLNTSIKTADDLGQLDPTDAEDKVVQDALTKAKAVQADQNVDQATVDAAKIELDNAVNIKKSSDAKEAQALKAAEEAKQAALDALKVELEKAKAVNKADYTPDSVKPLAEAETTGQAVVDNASVKTIKEIEAATQVLKESLIALQAKADKAQLDKAIETAENINIFDPGDKEDEAVLVALSNAKEVQANPNVSQADVDAASKALKDAVKAKQVQDAKEAKQAALDALKAELEKAKAVNKADYTPDSVKPLTDAVTTGQAIVENTDDVSTDDIQDATKAIQTSLNALKVIQTFTSDNTTDKDQSLSSQSVTNNKAIKKLESSRVQFKQTTKSNKVLPNTGQEVLIDPKYASLIFALGGLMTLFSRRKKEEKNTEK